MPFFNCCCCSPEGTKRPDHPFPTPSRAPSPCPLPRISCQPLPGAISHCPSDAVGCWSLSPLPRHGLTSWPGLGLSPSPGKCLMPGTGAALLSPAVLLLGWQDPALMAPAGISHPSSLRPDIFFASSVTAGKPVSEARFTSYSEPFPNSLP